MEIRILVLARYKAPLAARLTDVGRKNHIKADLRLYGTSRYPFLSPWINYSAGPAA